MLGYSDWKSTGSRRAQVEISAAGSGASRPLQMLPQFGRQHSSDEPGSGGEQCHCEVMMTLS